MTKVTNKLQLTDQQHSLSDRAVTIEDARDGLHTDSVVLIKQGPVYERLLTAVVEMHNHIKKNADISLVSGTFYFKGEESERPTLLFASNLKTDRPIIVLNPSIPVTLILQENFAMPPSRAVQLSPAGEAISRLEERRSVSQNKNQFGCDEQNDSDMNIMN